MLIGMLCSVPLVLTHKYQCISGCFTDFCHPPVHDMHGATAAWHFSFWPVIVTL